MTRPIDEISNVIRDAIIAALKDREAELTKIAEAGGKEAGGGILGDVGSLFALIDNIVGGVIDVVGFAFPPLEVLKQVDDAGGKMGRSFGIGYMLGYAGWQFASPLLLPIQHAISDLAQSEIFDGPTAADLQARGLMSHADALSDAQGSNLDQNHYDRLADAAMARPDPAQLLEMWNRKLVGETEVNIALQRHTFPEFWWDKIKALRRQLLSPADLALAFLRSEIDDVTMYGYAEQLGVSRDDMDVLVANTGEPPGPEQLMEAIRRGFIDRARFERGIRQSRVRNEWQDVEYALRQSPMSTSDAVRAVVENYLTDDEGKAIAEQNGLLPEHWRPMREAFGRPLSHEQMMQLYHRGLVTLDDVHQAFRESDLKDKYIGQAVELGRRLVPERTIVSMLNHGVIGHDRAMTMLHEQGFNDADAESLIKLGTAERLSAHKALSRTDLLQMYENKLLTTAQARDHLTALGYSKDDADAMLKLADIKSQAATLRATERAIEASLKAHHLTEQEAINQLEHAGLEHKQARALIDEWLQQRGTVTRTLSEAQILKLGKDGLLTVDDTLQRLTATGLGESDARLLMMDRGIIKPPGAH